MPTNQQRRDAERRRLQKQLEERRAREAARKRATLITSIVGTVVLIAVVVIVVVVTTGGSDNSPASQAGKGSQQPTNSASPSTTAPTVSTPTAPCSGPPKGDTATFAGFTIKGATDLKHEPPVSGTGNGTPSVLSCEDLVVGKGPAAAVNSSVTVQYVGLVYSTGNVFQSSWTNNTPATFTVGPGQVIDGFYQGIAGAGKVAPMHVGGRRIIVMPAAVAYGANPPGGSGIPPNATLAFIVDLQKVNS